jgi:thymidylate synthase
VVSYVSNYLSSDINKNSRVNWITEGFAMKNYLEFLQHIKNSGMDRTDRTGVGTRSVFGCDMRFDLSQGFPLLTTKKTHFKSVVYELLWFLQGSTNTNYLTENGVRIWNEWADENGDLGPVYGKQWRSWGCSDGRVVDQIANLIEGIKTNPDSRRHIVSAWNVGELDKMALPPCHAFFQFYVASGRLSCKLTQRSADAFLGVPFNIASYSLLTHMIAEQCDLDVGEFIWSGGDCHIYHNHFQQVEEQLSRTPSALPQLLLDGDVESVFDYQYENIKLIDYFPQSAIKAPIAV